MPDDAITATIFDATAGIPAEVWNRMVPSTAGRPDNPFLDHAFFLAAEESGCATRRTGWQPQHVLLESGGEPLGLMPLFLKSHSQGEYIFDHGWAQAYEQAGGNYYPKLLSAIPFTPVTTQKLLVPSGDTTIRRGLLTTAETHAQRLGVSSVHANFVPEDEALLAADSRWLVRHDTQFHWHNAGFGNFEDFLGTMSSRHRKVTRRERRDALAADGLTVKWLTGSDLTEAVWDAFFEFYMDTGSRKWGRPYFNRRFFSLLSAAMANRIVLMFAYDGDEPVAGTLSLAGTDTLYGRYWGATREVPFLHFELCYYQAIDFAIAHGLAKVEAGAQGEHKLARGYAPSTTRSVHWIGHPGLRQAVASFVEQERRSVAEGQRMLNDYTPFRKGDPETT